MPNKPKQTFTLGGSIETALSGNYELKVGAVLKEGWKFTFRHLASFSPAIITLLLVQLAIFFIVLKLQIGDPWLVLTMFTEPEAVTSNVVQAIFVANLSYEVISAPLVAGVSLMAMSHAAGLKTQTKHILKGLQFTIPVTIATILALSMQGIAGKFLPLVSMYLSLVFSNSTLLICEKRLSPLNSLWISFRAVNKKLFPIATLYIVLMVIIFLSAIFYGILLIVSLPFFFHVKGIIYRNMFGITLNLVSTVNYTGPTGNEDQSSVQDHRSAQQKTPETDKQVEQPNNQIDNESKHAEAGNTEPRNVQDKEPQISPTNDDHNDHQKGSNIFNA